MELWIIGLLGFTLGIMFTLALATVVVVFIVRWAVKQQEKNAANLVASMAAAGKGIRG